MSKSSTPWYRKGMRFAIAIMGSIGLGIIYGLKVNLHVAIVGMVNRTAIGEVSKGHAEPICPSGGVHEVEEKAEDGPFEWSSYVQGLLLSAYFWGYIIAQIPGGRIAEEISAKWVMFFSVAINIVCTLLTPLLAKVHWGALIAVRIGQGIGGGVTFPAMHVMLAHWAPPTERSLLSSIVYAGTALGTVIFMLITGLIIAAFNWEMVFYIEGGASLAWLILWASLAADTPQTHKCISDEEKNYIASSLHQSSEAKKHMHHAVPWKSVLTSAPFLAILIAHVCSNWGWYMVLIELPLYMKAVLNFKMSQNAMLTALPFLCMWIFSMILSETLDILLKKEKITTTTARKVATAFASIPPTLCFIALCYIGCEKLWGVVLMTLAVMTIGGMFSGFLSNHIDIAPNFAGTLMALTNTVATIPGIAVPLFVGFLTGIDQTIWAWKVIFFTTVALYVIEIIVYLSFGSGEEQKWNEVDDAGEGQPLKTIKKPPKAEC